MNDLEDIMLQKEFPDEGISPVYIATISGGKDSVTMCDLLLKNNYPVDYIVFCDTLQEFDEMYVYLDRVDEYLTSRYGISITRLSPKSTFEDWCFGEISRGERKGMVRGIPTIDVPCYWRRESKVKVLEEFENSFDMVYKYIGYTKDEARTIDDTNKLKHIFPLRDDFMMTERNCQEYLINQDMENPLYRHFDRTGCRMCPYQSEQSFFNVWKHYPDTWLYMKSVENGLNGSVNDHWFTDRRSILDMEKEFIEMDKQGSLFDFSDEPLKDCFCKI